MAEEKGAKEWLVPRKYWGAEQSFYKAHLFGPASSVFITYTGLNPCSNEEWCIFAIRKLQNLHIHKRMCPDIRYNFCIGGDGRVYEGRGWDVRPTLPKQYNDYTCTSLYIAYMGHFKGKQPGDHMYEAVEKLLIHGVQEKYIKPKFLQFQI